MSSKSIIITVVVVVVIGVGSFYGGTVYEKSSLSKQGLLRSASAGQFGNGAQRGQGQGMLAAPDLRGVETAAITAISWQGRLPRRMITVSQFKEETGVQR